jgi:hypothetical protein
MPTYFKPADVNNPVLQAQYGVSPANAANYYSPSPPGYPKANGSLIDVGSYPQSVSPYGTLDQAGNAQEWTETAGDRFPDGWNGGQVWVYGGDYTIGVGASNSTTPQHMPWADTNFFGFRVGYVPATEVPEPGSIVMLAVIAAVGLLYKWRGIASAV